MTTNIIPPHKETQCYHCGESCKENNIIYDDKNFCCHGCQTVYAILADNHLTKYYDWTENKKPVEKQEDNFEFLDNIDVQKQLFQFQNDEITKITFNIPSMHCSACVWLLENLYKINPAIVYGRVDFQHKKLSITYQHAAISLKQIAKLLTNLGYKPYFNLEDTHQIEKRQEALQKENRILIGKIAIAGFCFSNIMTTSFPEYFGFDSNSIHSFKYFFQFVNIMLTIPVFFYSGFDYIITAYQNLRKGFLNLDFPLALGIIVLFLRSLFEIFSGAGVGYLDTLAGLIFFLLLGKWFQQRTYTYLRYDRDFKAYFPMVITKIDNENNEQICGINAIKKEDTIIVKNNELIPADALLISQKAEIDYSFVTGEATPIQKKQDDFVYAGGKNIGANIHLKVQKEVQQSYLTSLWNNEMFAKKEDNQYSLQNILGRYFSIGLIIIALSGFLFWGITENWGKAINIFTAVLIIACPCALTLSAPFALGTAISIFGKYGIYLKNTTIIEKIAQINTIIFDKTGTLTQTKKAEITFFEHQENEKLSQEQQIYFWALAKNSIHILSKQIELFFKNQLQSNDQNFDVSCYQYANLSAFKEEIGLGIEGFFGKDKYKIGSKKWVGISIKNQEDKNGTIIYLQINEKIMGYFVIQPYYRKNIKNTIKKLEEKYKLYLLSGDNQSQKTTLSSYFKEENNLYFEQTPYDKQNFITDLQVHQNQKIMMLGDGLNDAGALQKANVGLAITDNIAYFTPASDGIIEGKAIEKLPDLIDFSKKCIHIVHFIFVLSLFYNVCILSIALSGVLSPLIAAILMPISSVSFITLATFLVWRMEKKWKKRQTN